MSKSELDYTMMSTFNTCRRKFDYRFNRGLVGQTGATAPDFGKGVHCGLDSWYVTRDVDQAIGMFKKNYKEQPEVDDKRTWKMGEWILKNYDTTYQDQPWKLVQSEQSFEIPLPNGNKHIGRIDKIVDWDGMLWVVDHKTTSQLGASYFKMAEPNLQFLGYVWAARQMGYQVVGVIVDAILVAKGLLEASSRAKLTPLARYDKYVSQEELDEWLETVLRIHGDIKICADQGVWYPNFDACNYYGECSYRRVCKEPKDIRERIIQLDYRVEHWDPRRKDDE